jgi:uncharacterized repeat protein (TIGR02543 family)
MNPKRMHIVSNVCSLLVVLVLGVGGTIAPILPAHEVRADAGVTVDGTPTTKTASSGTSVSWTHTTGTGANRLMLVGVSYNSNTAAVTVSSVTFTPSGGSALSLNQVISRKYASNFRYAAIWYLPTEPPINTSGTVLVTFSASVSSGIVAGAANFQGVDTTTPLGTPNGADASSNAVSVTLTGLAGDELVFDDLFVGGTSTSASVSDPQSQLWNAFISPTRGAASTEQAAGSSVVMDWSLGGSYIWVDVAVPIFPACTGERYTLTAGNDGHGAATLTPAGGSYCSGRSVTLTPVPNSGYLFSGWVGANASEVVNTAGVYTIVMDGDKSVTANFAPPSCQDVSLTVEDDTYLSGGATTTNYGNSATLQVAGSTTAANERTALLRWDLSSIPSNATLSTAGIQLQVTDASTYAYPLYDLTRAWVEGNGTAGSGATWATYDGTTAWGTAGAAGTTGSVDRGITNLWSSTTSSFSSTGSKTVSLNADGLALVQGWVAGSTNNGVIIQDYTSGSSNNLIFESSESTTEANKPKLNINYCLPDNTAPDQPVLVSPAPDGATGVDTSPTLEVTVSDTDGNATDVTFYGREVGAGTWQDLGTAYAVASGANATMAWPGLTESTQYEWYVTVDDGPATTTGPTWSFTTFAATCYALTLGHTGNGTDPVASPTSSTGCSAGEYVEGEIINLSGAMPDSGWQIDSWTNTDDDSSTGSTNTVTMPASALTVYVNYTEIPPTCYALTLGHTGQGSDPAADPTSSTGCSAGEYVEGEIINLSGAMPDSGWQIDSWTNTDDDSSTGSTNTVTMPASALTVYVNYTEITHDLTMAVDPSGGGTTDPAVGVHTYAYGTVVDITATAEDGYAFDYWSGACTGSGACQVTMEEDKTVTAHFVVTYDLTMGVDPSGGGTTDPVEGVHTYRQNDLVPIEATANPRWVFDNWTGDVADPDSASTTVTMDGNKTVTAHFTQVECTLWVVYDGNGSVALNPYGGTYACGTVVRLTAVPEDGWSFDQWSGDVTGSTNPQTITMDGDKSVTAHFVAEVSLLGDVNGDHLVNSTDALIVLSCDAGLDTSGFCPMNCGDVNADGLVNSTDALIILSYDAHLTVLYPVGEPGCPSSVTPCAGCTP